MSAVNYKLRNSQNLQALLDHMRDINAADPTNLIEYASRVIWF
jgi:hypothetical protein